MYQVHPALPGYLAAGWRTQDPGGYNRDREMGEQALCTACAALSRWLTRQIASGNAALAYTVIGLQRWTLGAMLGHALDHQAWSDANGIVRALDAYWDTRGLGTEATAWADRITAATIGPGQAPAEPAEGQEADAEPDMKGHFRAVTRGGTEADLGRSSARNGRARV